jgi:hypothetical protein
MHNLQELGAMARGAQSFEALEKSSPRFVEVETGKGADALYQRPQWTAVLAAGRTKRYAVRRAKLDQLSRDVAFVAGLMAEKVRIVAELRGRTLEAVPAQHLSFIGPSERLKGVGPALLPFKRDPAMAIFINRVDNRPTLPRHVPLP